jgi:hypothetical protein
VGGSVYTRVCRRVYRCVYGCAFAALLAFAPARLTLGLQPPFLAYVGRVGVVLEEVVDQVAAVFTAP